MTKALGYHIIDKWKEIYPLEDLCEIARVATMEDSYQLARLAQYLEIQGADERYPKTMLSDMLKDIPLLNVFNY